MTNATKYLPVLLYSPPSGSLRVLGPTSLRSVSSCFVPLQHTPYNKDYLRSFLTSIFFISSRNTSSFGVNTSLNHLDLHSFLVTVKLFNLRICLVPRQHTSFLGMKASFFGTIPNIGSFFFVVFPYFRLEDTINIG